jgi:hypothetical protein
VVMHLVAHMEVYMIKKKANLFAIILCGFFVLASAASAQQKDTDAVKFSASVYAEYTDNRDSKAVGDSNFDTYLMPRVDINLHGERDATLDFHYAPYYRYRSNPSTIQNKTELFHDLGLSTVYQSSPVLGLRFQDNFYKTDDPAIDSKGTTLRRDASYVMNYVTAGANYQLSNRRTLVDFSGRDTIKRYDDALVAVESDEDNKGVCFTGWHQAQRTLALLGVLDYAQFAYDSSKGIERGFNAISAGAGLEKIVSKNLNFNLRAGVIGADYKDPSLKSQSAPFASLDVAMSSTPAARIDATLSYLLRDSDVYPFPSQECTQFYTRMEWDTSKMLTFGLTGTYRTGKYSNTSLTPEGLAYQKASAYKIDGNEVTLIAGADATYAVDADSSTVVKLALSHENVKSDVSESYTRNGTSLTLSRKF